jgi:hypothetical protein
MADRIPDTTLQGNYIDGYPWDARLLNKVLDILILGINANYQDIVTLEDKQSEAASGSFVSQDGKTVTVVDGLITSIE